MLGVCRGPLSGKGVSCRDDVDRVEIEFADLGVVEKGLKNSRLLEEGAGDSFEVRTLPLRELTLSLRMDREFSSLVS